jgi:hypothetical protein
MSQVLNYAKDVQGKTTNGLVFPVTAKNITLPDSSTESFTVPNTSDKWLLILNYQPDANIWVSVNNTASPPIGGTWADSTSISNPEQLVVNADDEISFNNNSGSAKSISAALYTLPSL